MSKSSALSLGPEWTRLKSGSSKVLKDDKSASNGQSGQDNSKVKLPWSGIAAGGLTGSGAAGNLSGGGGVAASLKKKNSGSLSPDLNSGNAGGGVFAISAAAGGSGLFGSKKGLSTSSENEPKGTGNDGSNSAATTTSTGSGVPSSSTSTSTSASSVGPYRIRTSRSKNDSEVTPINLRNNAGGKKYSSKQMLAIWDKMKRSNEFKESKKLGISDLMEGGNGNGNGSSASLRNHHNNHHHPNSNNGTGYSPGSAAGVGVAIGSGTAPAPSTFTSKLFSPFGRYKTSTDLYYSNSSTGPVNYDPPPKEFDQSKQRLYNRDGEVEKSSNDNGSKLIDTINTTTATNILPTLSSTSVTNTDSWSPFGNFSITPSPSTLNDVSNPQDISVNNNRVGSSSNLIGLATKATASSTSDFFNSPIKRVATPLSSATPPPGISSPQPTIAPLIPAENIQWVYKDPSGVEQGPFSGKLMHDWYTGNWLKEDLLIKRVGESEYIQLHELKVKIGNFSEPFRVSLPPVLPSSQPSFQFAASQQQQQFPQPTVVGAPYFDDLQRDVFRNHQQFTLGTPTIPNAWGSPVASPGPMSPISPWNQHVQPHQQSQPSSFFQDQSILTAHATTSSTTPLTPAIAPPQVAVSAPIQESSTISSALLSSSSSICQSLWKGVDSIEEKPIGTEETEIDGGDAVDEKIVSPVIPKSELSKSEIKKAKKKAKAEQAVNEKTNVKVGTSSTEVQSTAHISEPTVSSSSISSSVSPSPAPVPALAPWAKKDTKPKPLSLKEIQELEAAERVKQNAKQQELHHQQVLAARIANSAVTSSGPTLPSAAKWASAVTSTASPRKTLAEIQKEEELAAQAQKRAQAQAQAANPTTAPILPSGKRYAEIASPGSSLRPTPTTVLPDSTATASSNTPPSAWTTVGPGGRKVSSPFASAAPPSAASVLLNRPTPSSALRVSSAPAQVSAPKVLTASDEFLQWCKSSLQDLNAGINQNELLSILLSLPATPDSKEIIAETIYSNSSTMDGRRFSEEFLKRRNVADREKSGETWSDILQRNSTVAKPAENDGWNPAFKVVSKKKNKRTEL